MKYDAEVIQLLKDKSYPTFSNNNTKVISVLYEARNKYKTESIDTVKDICYRQDPDFVIPFGDIYNENLLYGILDDENDIILPRIQNLVDVGQIYNNSNAQQLLQDFCVDALRDMKNYYQEANLLGKLSQDSKYGNLQIFKTYNDVYGIHRGMHNILATDFKDNALRLKHINSSITDYKKFIEKYIDYLVIRSREYPITLSQAVLYSNISSFSSGIMFTIDEADAGNDIVKYEEFLFSPNFFAFAEMCKRFGFKIDKNIPWLSYVDLNSPAMIGNVGNHKGYLSSKNINNIKQFFQQRFEKVYKLDLDFLKYNMYYAYAVFISEGNNYYNETDNKLCQSSIKNYNVKERTLPTLEKFFAEYPDTYWLRLYTYFRNLETKRGLTQVQFDNIVREANQFVKYGRKDDAMKYINDYFKDYKYLAYISSLQEKNDMLEDKVTNAGVPVITL